MRICCLPTNQHNGTDYWVTARNEGRSIMNIGVVLASLGHEVDITATTFTKTTMAIRPNLNIIKDWNNNTQYKYVIGYNAYNGSVTGQNYDKFLYMYYGKEPDISTINTYFPRTVAMLTPILGAKECSTITYLPVDYFPHVYPLPCFDKIKTPGFQPYRFDSSKEEIKIWANMSTWYDGQNYLAPDSIVLEALRFIRDVVKKRINLTICVKDARFTTTDILAVINEEFKPNIIQTFSRNYFGVLSEIYDNDMCIIKGNTHSGGMSAIDAISLGVPMLYVTSGSANPTTPDGYIINRTLWKAPESCLRVESTASEREQILKRFFDDPVVFCNRFADVWRDNSIEEWSKIISPILEKYK